MLYYKKEYKDQLDLDNISLRIELVEKKKKKKTEFPIESNENDEITFGMGKLKLKDIFSLSMNCKNISVLI